jgi:hypothetical protein
LSAWYVALVWNLVRRPLWFDELYTFYIAQQPTVARMMEAIRTVDLNPPLNYFLTRWSIALFGASPWAARLPAIVAFWGGSLAIFALVRRRSSALFAVIGVLLFWSTAYFAYAAEARPYGLLLGLTAILLAAWDATVAARSKAGLATVLTAGILLLLAHIFGTLSLGAVWVGEAIRAWKHRKIDWPMAAVLLLPLCATITYAPMFRSYSTTIFPPEIHATWGKLWFLYYAVFRWMWRPLLAISVVALLLRSRVSVSSEEKTSPWMSVTLALLFLVPVLLTILFMRSHGAFYDRYGMAAVLPVVLVAPLLLRRWTHARSSAAFAALCSVALLLLLSTALRPVLDRTVAAVLPPRAATKVAGILTTSVHGPFRPWWTKLPVPADLLAEREQAPQISSLENFHPDLPLVAASELTFLEMDNREPADLAHRLLLLYDRKAEIEIAHRSIADGMLNVREFFPLRGTILPYESFVREHNQFLVIGLYEHPGDWLLRKAEADRATLQVIARYEGYTDTDIYLVTYPPILH